MKYLLVLLLCTPALAERISRSGSSYDCRSVKVLVIGGELQPNTWGNCSKESHGINSDWYKNKVTAEREAYKAKQEAERAKRKEVKARESKGEEKKCRGIGAAAGCAKMNPGHTEVKKKGNSKGEKGKKGK